MVVKLPISSAWIGSNFAVAASEMSSKRQWTVHDKACPWWCTPPPPWEVLACQQENAAAWISMY
jgi:hypothetical protein